MQVVSCSICICRPQYQLVWLCSLLLGLRCSVYLRHFVLSCRGLLMLLTWLDENKFAIKKKIKKIQSMTLVWIRVFFLFFLISSSLFCNHVFVRELLSLICH